MHGLNAQLNDRLNELKYQDLQREIEYLHLLREAEAANPGLLAHIGKIVRERLQALGFRQKVRESFDKGMYQPTSKKSSP